MLFQQSAELGVLRTQGSLCIAHTVMIADRHDARHASGVSGLSKVSTRLAPYKISAHPGSLAVDLGALGGTRTHNLLLAVGRFCCCHRCCQLSPVTMVQAAGAKRAPWSTLDSSRLP
jgi:hypothetical protein